MKDSAALRTNFNSNINPTAIVSELCLDEDFIMSLHFQSAIGLGAFFLS